MDSAARSDILMALTKDKLTPLHCACQAGHVQVVRFILCAENGSGIERKVKEKLLSAGCSRKLTALHYACQQGHIGVVRCLLGVYPRSEDVHLTQGLLMARDRALRTPTSYLKLGRFCFNCHQLEPSAPVLSAGSVAEAANGDHAEARNPHSSHTTHNLSKSSENSSREQTYKTCVDCQTAVFCSAECE